MFSILISALMTFSYAVSNVPDYSHKAHLENVYQSQLGSTYDDDTLYQGEFVYTYSCDLYFNSDFDWYITNFKQQIQFYFDDGSAFTSYLIDVSATDSANFYYYDFDTFSNYYYSLLTINTQDQEIDYSIHAGSTLLQSGYVDDLGYDLLYYYEYEFTLIDNGNLYQNIIQYIKSTFYYDGVGTNYYNDGYQDGYRNGYDTGYSDAETEAYQTGFSDGYADASEQDSTAVTIFSGFVEVGLLPVNVFLGILNFEVFGINIGALCASLMTVAIVVIIIRIVTGKKDD